MGSQSLTLAGVGRLLRTLLRAYIASLYLSLPLHMNNRCESGIALAELAGCGQSPTTC